MDMTIKKPYKIKGTLQVSYENKKTAFSLFPDAAYINPDKKSAVLYQDDADGVKGAVCKIDLIENKLNIKTSVTGGLKDLLTQLALQNKPVELHLDESCETITGFTYPAR